MWLKYFPRFILSFILRICFGCVAVLYFDTFTVGLCVGLSACARVYTYTGKKPVFLLYSH